VSRSSSRTSDTNLAKLRALSAERIRVTAEHPEADVRHVVRGIVRRGLKPISKKQSIALRVDADVLEWFKVTHRIHECGRGSCDSRYFSEWRMKVSYLMASPFLADV
jgi:uncharacterized protein (DUF4415 family)